MKPEFTTKLLISFLRLNSKQLYRNLFEIHDKKVLKPSLLKKLIYLFDFIAFFAYI